ncbi:MAG: glycosyltransferase [Polaribacter sp.]
MKLLHIINSLHFGGAEKLLLDTVPEFKKKGLDVEVMVLHNEKTFFYQELEERYKIKIIAPKKLRSIYSLSHIFWIRKYIKQYDIIHVHLFPSLYWLGFATLFLKHKTKLLFTEHSTENRRRHLPLFKYLDKYIYNKYHKIIAISEGVKNNLQNYLRNNHTTIKLINNGINTKLFQESIGYSNSDIGLPEKAKIVIQISSFTDQKDQDTLLKAIELLPKDVHLLLVGNGVLIEEKKKLASHLKISERVHFLGYRNDVSRLLKTSDICILSSHYEGFGLAIVEGMASGLPCVATNVDGLSQVVESAGLLFESKDHIKLKEILHQLFSNKEYYDKVSKQCADRAKQYDISLMIDAHINLYNEMLN